MDRLPRESQTLSRSMFLLPSLNRMQNLPLPVLTLLHASAYVAY